MRLWNEVRFGIDRKDLLESALNRPIQAASYSDSSIEEQAATLCFGLIKNHPWLGGNKRTATFLTEFFLELNGLAIEAELDEIVQFALDIDLGEIDLRGITNWISEHVVEA